jgi:hypothetical protein
MFKCTATNRNKKPTTIREHSKIPGCCLMVAVASTIQAIKSSLESTSHNHLLSLDSTEQACGLSPRSLDITPMEFFMWGHIKALIYT